MTATREFIEQVPKVEMHLHIEGTLEPELAFELATRNGVKLPYSTPEELRKAYDFGCLQDFLDLYYAGCSVLIKEEDFYDLTWQYLCHCKEDNVVHTEIFFDPQTHTDRKVSFDTVINGIHKALKDGETKLGITSKLIMCFLRHLEEESALQTLEQAKPHLDKIVAIGLDSGEKGNPPSKFEKVFAKGRELGLLTVAHAGEEGDASYIWEALELLKVSRIDHGVRCDEDEKLMALLAEKRIPLTVCPLSNNRLQVYPDLTKSNTKKLLDKGLCVTVNSDDPAYFGGYMVANFVAIAEAVGLSNDDVRKICLNSVEATFLSASEKEKLANLVAAC